MPVKCKNIFATECRTATNLKYKKMLGFNFALIFDFFFYFRPADSDSSKVICCQDGRFNTVGHWIKQPSRSPQQQW